MLHIKKRQVVSSYGIHSADYSYLRLLLLYIDRTVKLQIRRELDTNFIGIYRDNLPPIIMYHYVHK